MELLYKDDWQAAKERLLAWWDHDYFGRCAIAVTAPRDNPPDIPPPPPAESPEQRWFDLDWNSSYMAHHLSRCYFGGEALPVWHAGYAGVASIPTILGCPIESDMATSWWRPILTEPDHIDFHGLALDEDSDSYRFGMRMLARAVEEARGKSLPTVGAFGGCGDTLAALRGTERLLIDCLERPEQVYAAEEFLMDMWCDFYDRRYAVIRDACEGSTCWFTLWSPGKFYAAQNDFSYNIGPDMFRELFIPIIRQQTEFLDHAVYHVDGINAFRHVAALCELPRLQALQILPGAGKGSPLQWMDTLKQVQAAGKNVHISIPADEVEPALAGLSARGLYIQTSAKSENQARELLRRAEQWSVDRG